MASKVLGSWGPVTALQVGSDVVARIKLSGEPDGASICCNHVSVYVRDAEFAAVLHRSAPVLVEIEEAREVIPLGSAISSVSQHSSTGASGTKRWVHFQFKLDSEPNRATLLRFECVRRRRLYWEGGLGGVFGAGFEAELAQLTLAVERLLALGTEPDRLRTWGVEKGSGLDVSVERLLGHPHDVREQMRQIALEHPKRRYGLTLRATRVDVPPFSVVQAINQVFDQFPESFRESSQVSVVQASLTGQAGLLRFCERWCKALKYVQASSPGPRGSFIDAGPYSGHSPWR